jgi:CubicO group peptidase (beta-lactamase class C family)
MSGLSKSRLERLRDVMSGYVERGEVPGVVTCVCRRGETFVDTLGTLAAGGSEPMRRDSLFRISSMTKPVTAVAAMILVEECLLRLDEPVDRLLPELAGRRVLTRPDGPLDSTVAANRPISVRDLLTFRMGVGSNGPAGPHRDATRDLIVTSTDPAGPDEWMRRLGTFPLMYQPGERWLYNTSADVLGVLVARASGQPFDDFLAERVFAPLGMVDTAFTTSQPERLTASYSTDPVTGALTPHDDPAASLWSRRPSFLSGGGSPEGSCLLTTVDDYAAFGRMLLGGGRDSETGTRILSRPSVETMTTDQLTPAQHAGDGFWPGYFDAMGWGFGLCVTTRRAHPSGSVGAFGWDGGLGTVWRSDPAEDMVTILLSQCGWTSPKPPNICQDFWTGAYQAIDD